MQTFLIAYTSTIVLFFNNPLRLQCLNIMMKICAGVIMVSWEMEQL